MKKRLIVLSSCLLACGSTATPPPTIEVEPPAPAPQAVVDTVMRSGYTRADVQFMQGMIGHHAQALVMTDMVRSRTQRPVMHMMAERIAISQRDEIAYMQRWLKSRNEAVPAAEAHVHAAMGHGTLMPGMLTKAELDSLAGASGLAFDRLFLQLMIKHHEGAIQMLRQLFATPSSGQEPELFVFASDVDADQSAEIKRMRAMLSQL